MSALLAWFASRPFPACFAPAIRRNLENLEIGVDACVMSDAGSYRAPVVFVR